MTMVRYWLAGLALSVIWGSGEAALGQVPVPPGPKKVYTNRTAFKLPIRLEDKDRPRLEAVELYVRNGPQGVWTMQQSVPPTQNEFIYRVTQDGDHEFTLVTVEKNGNRTPADLATAQPSLIVVVDRQPPEVDVKPVTSPFGAAMLQCEVRDAHPDESKTKLEYRTADQTWQALEPLPDQPTMFRVPDPSALRGIVRATASDLAGNTTTREINLLGAAGSPSTEGALASSPIETRLEKPAAPAPGIFGAPPRQFINKTHFPLLYQIDHEGPSGVAKVEVWMTRDEGQTWQKLCEDPDRHSPVEIDLPGDGVYGLSVAVTSGSGAGGGPPARGEAPDWRVEVDTTKPEAQILAVRPGTGAEAGSFLITWTASDKNLKPDPIDLEYASHPDGPWMPIAKGIHNDGNYRWSGPAEAVGEVYVRMQVTDQAGNVTTCAAPQPLIFDRARPKAKVIGIMNGPTITEN